MYIQPSTDENLSHKPIKLIETLFIVFLSLMTIVLPIYTAFNRLFFDNIVTGAILFTQHLTLWIGFFGALLATGYRAHLSLATGQFIKNPIVSKLCNFLAQSLSAAVTLTLAYATIIMIQADSHNDSKLFQWIPEWLSEIAMPLTLVLIAIRCIYFSHSLWRYRILALLLSALPLLLGLAEEPFAFLKLPLSLLIFLAILLGAPIYVGMVGYAMLFFYLDQTPIATVPIEIFRLVASPTLPAIPLLTLCGFILAEGGASKRFMELARSIFGFFPGGIAIVITIVCALFTTLTGGSGVTIIALGGLTLPLLIKEGYNERFSLGLVTAAGSLGLLLPPSMPVILYSVVAEIPADKLYLAGLIPSIVFIAVVILYVLIFGTKDKKTLSNKNSFSIKEILRNLWIAKWELLIPLVIVIGIFGGKTTIVEAAAIATFLAVIVEVFVFKDLNLKRDLPKVIVDSAKLIGSVLIVLGSAMGLTSYLVDAQIPTVLLTWVTTHIHSQALFLLSLNIILLILGSTLEIYSAIVILAPLIVPLGQAYSIHPVHMGMIFLANLELGFLFPPLGLNLLLSASRFNKPLTVVYKVALPFLFIMIIAILLITYIPSLSLILLKS